MIQQRQQQQPVDMWEAQMVNVVYNFCAIVTMPAELALRPWHGTRYFTPVHLIAASVMMIILPLVFGIAGAVGSMIPFSHAQASMGFLDMGGVSRLFFLGCLVHGIRKWRLMSHPEREAISTYEGEPLFFFKMLPKSSFWRIRILYEPAFLFACSIMLPNLFIVTPGVGTFLVIMAILLAMKGYVSWYVSWEEIRRLLDAKNAGPIIADIIENRGTEADFAKVHIASVPDDKREPFVAAWRARVMPEVPNGN